MAESWQLTITADAEVVHPDPVDEPDPDSPDDDTKDDPR